MTSIPFNYIFRNLWTRLLTTVLTALGMALVVFVFAAVLMLDAGLKQTMVGTGSFDNVVMIRKGSDTEIQSGVYRDQASLIESMPQIARAADGTPLVSREIVVLNSLRKRAAEGEVGSLSNVVIRGLLPIGVTLRPQVKIVEGRMFRPGSTEVIVGKNVTDQFEGAQIGQTLSFAQRKWLVVGRFDGQKSAFDSELWGDAEQLMQSFRRINYSSTLAKLADSGQYESLKNDVENDVRLSLDVKREQIFYEDQSRALSTFITILGSVLSVIFSIGAMLGAMVTMYSSVANRTAEIGTLRALGFQRRNILVAFLMESLLLAFVGGIIGLIFASFLQALTISTLNFQSFSQLAFGFLLTPTIVIQTLIFSLFMGLVGGFFPSVRAARMKIVDSLRAV